MFTERINPRFTLQDFIVGESNANARACVDDILGSPSTAKNILLIYGSTGVGKTHLMQSLANAVRQQHASVRIAYLSAEQWMNNMVVAKQLNCSDGFISYFCSVDILLVDDIHFFANEKRIQDNFTHALDVLIAHRKQIVLSSDRHFDDVDGLVERFKSQLRHAHSVHVERPELETRVTILLAKAKQAKFDLPEQIARLIAHKISSNVRDLEGALDTLSAGTSLRGINLTIEHVYDILRDHFIACGQRHIALDEIKRAVCGYYKIRLTDLMSSSKASAAVRPRQIAMALATELTFHSSYEIGEYFRKDHTTALRAYHNVVALRKIDLGIQRDYENLLRKINR